MEIKDARNQIDEIDRELTALFEKRMRLAAEIAEDKRQNGLPVLDAAREREVIERLTADCDPEMKGYIEELYLTVFRLSRSYQQTLLEKEDI